MQEMATQHHTDSNHAINQTCWNNRQQVVSQKGWLEVATQNHTDSNHALNQTCWNKQAAGG